ncbi:DEAD/DEAH box helicase [Nocardioides sp. SOB44]|uniref:DEAD/DEAH box helicase n=1 Tax=Nocardioides cremeus TaxID=3058044 RepID=A0ABT8TLR2_9ACTN|nr:DEAD/DEAH box helicase [Nocardioides cremeus]MDO3394902.1 DEAD/DEAH box helicase [Nocardioides cremeus]
MTGDITYTEDQQEAIEAVLEWLADPDDDQVFRLFGYAGTGKTTTLKGVLDAIEGARPDINYWLAAPTGKAAHVVHRKTGYPTTTLHAPGYIYAPVSKEAAQDPRHSGWVRSDRFVVVPAFDSKLNDIDLLVVDEASMVGAEVASDLLAMRGMVPSGQKRDIRVLAVGEPAQLDPVMQTPGYTDVPGDIVLRDVLRQNPGPVLTAATWLRDNEQFSRSAPELQAIMRHSAPLARLIEADAVIVHSNEERLNLSQRMREHVGKPAFKPVAGDTIMFRANQLSANIVNGMVALVGDHQTHADTIAGHTVFDRVVDSRRVCREGHDFYELTLRDGDLKVLTPVWIFEESKPYEALMPALEALGESEVVAPVQFAHVMTAHSAQGSEWDDVIVMEPKGSYYWRWLYTAITRARVNVELVWDVTADTEDHSGFLAQWLDALKASDLKPKVKGTGERLAEIGQRRLLSDRQTAVQIGMNQRTFLRHKAALAEARLIDGDMLTLPE